MDFGDLILVPIYIFILFIFFRIKRRKYPEPPLKKYHRQGFWIKMIGCFAFVIYNVYLSPGDSLLLYQTEGANICHLILKDTGNIHLLFQSGKSFDTTLLANKANLGYFNSEANYLVTKIVAVISFFSFGKYSVTCLIFSSIAFSGVWKLYLFFYYQYPKLHKKFAIAILYFPTFVFWSSGILKDTICIASIGYITYALYESLYRKKNIVKNTIILIVFGYMLMILKVYILLAYVPFFILFIILKNVQGLKNSLLKYLLAPALITMGIFAFSQLLSSYDQELGAYAIKDVTSSITNLNEASKRQDGREDAASNFDLGVEFDGSFQGLITISPIAIATTFFRPLIWEAHKISQLLAAMESLVLMFFTLYVILKAGLFTILKLILSDPLTMYCFFFSIIFAIFVGASTLNFGTLVRYKIPCLPFYTISLFLIYEKVKEKSIKKALQKSMQISSNNLSLNPSIS